MRTLRSRRCIVCLDIYLLLGLTYISPSTAHGQIRCPDSPGFADEITCSRAHTHAYTHAQAATKLIGDTLVEGHKNLGENAQKMVPGVLAAR